MNNSDLIKELESSNSRLFKEEILLREMNKENVVFFEGLKLAYNRLLTFGVKKIPESKFDGNGIIWKDFKNLSDELLKRKLTGHAARDEILKLMGMSHKDEWNFFYKRILQKDMRCGLSGKTINNEGKDSTVITKGRHDPCVGIRAVPIAEAMLALVLVDHALRHKAQNL